MEVRSRVHAKADDRLVEKAAYVGPGMSGMEVDRSATG